MNDETAIPRVVIAGTHSGVGKTSVAVGIMAALSRAGWDVRPFKVGPDYIDPGFHTAACGATSWSLDSWMLGEEGLRESFVRGARGSGKAIAVIEGMMGLHDSADPMSDRGSTAEVARLLNAPVILVIDGSGIARSAGALVEGYRGFDGRVRLAGVLANRVAGEGHAAYLRPAIESLGVAFLGWLPENGRISLPERHLGLVMPAEQADLTGIVDELASWVEGSVDVFGIAAAAEAAPRIGGAGGGLQPRQSAQRIGNEVRARVAVARDEAFCFYYPENLALLEEAGAELVFFSPLRDSGLPAAVDGLYLGGGYPEIHAGALSANRLCREALARRIGEGLPTFAECGGFMYLCESLVTCDGECYPMAGAVPGAVRMEPRIQAIGYREAIFARDNPLGWAGTRARGHEFRYSRLEGGTPADRAAFRIGDESVGYGNETLLASYVHLHFGSNPGMARSFVERSAGRR